MKKNKLSIFGGIIVVAIVAVAGYGIYVMSKSNVNNNSDNFEQNGNITQKVQYIDFISGTMKEVSEKTQYYILKSERENCEDFLDTSCWNTFVNEKYGYRIKYPKTWKIGLQDTSEKGRYIFATPISFNANDLYYAPLSVSVRDGEEKTFDEWYQSAHSNLVESEKITKNNTKFVVFYDNFAPHYYAVEGDKFIEFSLIDGFIDQEMGRKMMEKMIYSLEFID